MNPINPMNDYRPVRKLNPIGVLLNICPIDTYQREREIESTADQFQAKFLRETFLEPLQTYEKSTKRLFGAVRETERETERKTAINVKNDPYYYQ